MMKKLSYILAGLSVACAVVSCNSKSETYEILEAQSAMVTRFAFSDDSKVMKNLDTVFFTIDQIGHRIFNADSLPVGTDITRLVPRVSTKGSSIVEFHVSREGKADTIYNYLEDSTDSIDFTSPRVMLRIVSSDGQASNTYDITVNVHRTAGDTLVWSRLERTQLPTSFTAVNEQHTTQSNGTFYCLTRYESNFCMARADNPATTWQYTTPSFGFDPDIDSFTGSDDALYILDRCGNLYTSADGGATWTSTGRNWKYIFGAYGSKIVGSANISGTWYSVDYPGTAQVKLQDNFPVRNTSQAITRGFEMTDVQQMLVVGGRTASGSLTGSVWSYDGNSWMCVDGLMPVPEALENMTLVPYYTITTDTASWTTTRQEMLFAFNGNRADGTLNDTIYVSRDFGMNWSKADSLLQPPTTMPRRTCAQAFAYVQKMNADGPVYSRGGNSRGSWTNLAARRWTDLYINARIGGNGPQPLTRSMSRATQPITDWECPYLYMFGGRNAEGQTMNQMYRGVIVRFTFKPLQ